MNDKIETKGKTVKDAVAEALLRLGTRRDEVIVTVLEEPKSGFLGLLGGRPAKVQVEKKRGGRPRGGSRRRGNSGGHSLSEGSGSHGGRGEGSRGRGGQAARGDGGRGRNRQPSGSGQDQDRNARDKGGQNRGSQDRDRGQNQGRGRGRGQNNDKRGRNPNRNEDPRRDQSSSEAANPDRGSRNQSRRGNPNRDNRRTEGQRDRNRQQRPAARAETSGSPSAQPERAAAREDRRDSGERQITGERNQRNRRGGRNRRSRPQETEQPRSQEQQSAATGSPAPQPTREQTRPRPAAREITNDQEAPRMENKPSVHPGSGTAAVIKEGLQGVSFAQAVRDVPDDEVKANLEKLAGGMLIRAGFPCRCQVLDGEYLQVRVVTDDASAGMLIGRHGATVDSVEHLVERMISTAHGDRVKMNLDINNYRRRRQDTLADRVDDAVNRVQETGREYHLEPMNARERRLVHLQVEEIEGLTTVTVAEDRSKHVVISREGVAGQADQEGAEVSSPVENTETPQVDSPENSDQPEA